MTVEVRTSAYEWAYGKKPRGRGNWAFGDSKMEKMEFFYGSYAEAKKQAIEWAKAQGLEIIHVGT